MKIPDNYDQYRRHEAEQERQRARLPVCDYCNDPVEDDHFFLVNDEIICPDCMDKHFRKDVDDYVA